jgi:hypothetical protein
MEAEVEVVFAALRDTMVSENEMVCESTVIIFLIHRPLSLWMVLVYCVLEQ